MFSSKHLLRNDEEYPTFVDQLRPVSEELLRTSSTIGTRTRLAIEEQRQRSVEEGRSEGHAVGYAEGYQAGLLEGRAAFDEAHRHEIEAFALALGDFIGRAEQSLIEWARHAEDSLTVTAIEVARETVQSELQISRDSIVAIARKALAEICPTGKVTLKCNPWDGSILESRRAEITQALAGVASIEVVEDPEIVGGCLIETSAGAVDATSNAFIDRLRDVA